MKAPSLDIFMAPGSVVVIGASRKTGRGSFNVIENMRKFGYRGKIFAVNPNAGEVLGLQVYRDVSELPEAVDLAVVSTPRETVPKIVEECAARSIKGAIVVPQGFTDADEEGRRLQDRLTAISRERGIRILGPNTLGVSNAFSGFTSSFMPLAREAAPVGVICQSGIFFVGSRIFTGIMGKGIDIGNGCDIDFAEALAYFGEDKDIQVIFIHIEGLRHGRRFYEAARNITPRKPVIAMKTATSRQGAAAAESHSGALVGEHELFEAAFSQAGVTSVKDPAEVLDLTKVFLNLPTMKGDRVGVITFTGAGGIILIDSLERNGLRLAALASETTRRIKDLSPPWMPIHNPMDIWPAVMKHGMTYVYEAALSAVLADGGVDGVICIAIAPELPESDFLDATRVIRETAGRFPEKPVAAWLYGPAQGAVSAALEQGGEVVGFPTLTRAARALAALRERGEFLSRAAAGLHQQGSGSGSRNHSD